MEERVIINLRILRLINQKNDNLHTHIVYWRIIIALLIMSVMVEIALVFFVIKMSSEQISVYVAAGTGIVVVLCVTWMNLFYSKILNVDSMNSEIDKEIYYLGKDLYSQGELSGFNKIYFEKFIL